MTNLLQLIEQQAGAWMAKDVDAIVGAFAGGALFISPGGCWQGKTEIRQAVQAFMDGVVNIDVDIKRVVFDGRLGAVEWTWRETRRADQRQYAADDGIIFELKDGLIVYWREYFDTAAFQESAADAFTLVEMKELSPTEIEPLLLESRAQGFHFVDTLASECADGTNRFDRPGEALYGIYCDDRLIAVGGLNRDPYLLDESVGRVRHLYVLSAWRRRGVGRLLIERIIDEARSHFRLLTLRTFDAEADRFYCALGFVAHQAIDSASHHMAIDEDETL